ncbi:MAG: SDR family oxidoreductase, partial [Rhodospirillaceae bacterium]|nr:SDR family oxidoreductase [Rhodospirillaceae bacterium]
MGDRLKDKVAIVTGAGASGPGWGNGKATAVLFAREGAKVFGIDRNEAAVDETAEIAKAEKIDFTPHIADITDPDQIEALIARCLERYGRIDILHNNVGIFELGSIEKDRDYFEHVQLVNVTSMFLMTKAVVPRMIEQGDGGAIVNLASVAATHYVGAPYSIYAATKSAVIGFTRAIALEHAAHRIRCNAIMPGVVNTPLALEPIRKKVGDDEFQKILGQRDALVPIGRAATGWDVAKAALFLCSDDASFITGV